MRQKVKKTSNSKTTMVQKHKIKEECKTSRRIRRRHDTDELDSKQDKEIQNMLVMHQRRENRQKLNNRSNKNMKKASNWNSIKPHRQQRKTTRR